MTPDWRSRLHPLRPGQSLLPVDPLVCLPVLVPR